MSTHVVSSERQTTRSHLEELDDGCGCAEVWEHVSERRTERQTTAEDAESEGTGAATGDAENESPDARDAEHEETTTE